MSTNNKISNPSLRTREINELLGKNPNYLITWGTSWFSVIVVSICLAIAFIEYPQTLSGDIVISFSKETEPEFPLSAKAEFDEIFCGKLAIGQKAIIELRSYPSQEFGILQGQIDSIDPVLVENKCVAMVTIKNLYTTKNIKVSGNFINLKGKISIVISEETLFKRFFVNR